MLVRQAIDEILSNDLLDSDQSEQSKCESIEKLIVQFGWLSVQNELINILADRGQEPKNWQTAAEVFWGAVLDKREIESPNRLIALLYKRCVQDTHSIDSNVAWSITSKIKGLGYLSDYDPLKDPLIEQENVYILY
jgi:hypothetical protein